MMPVIIEWKPFTLMLLGMIGFWFESTIFMMVQKIIEWKERREWCK